MNLKHRRGNPCPGGSESAQWMEEMAQHCHGEHEVMMVLVGALGLQPCQAAGQAQPHRSRWAFLLSLLNRQPFCPLTMDGPSFSPLSLSPQYFVLGITIMGLPCSKKNRVTPSSMSCQQPLPPAQVSSLMNRFLNRCHLFCS